MSRFESLSEERGLNYKIKMMSCSPAVRDFDQRLTTGRPFMSPASHGADLSQMGRNVALP